jgi:regulator of protease activity HflC (stomatin/prohibitin superfamily)
MERSIQKNGLINLLALLVVGVAGFAVARSGNSMAGQVSLVFIGLGILVAAVSWVQMRLEDSERLEKLELDELAKTRGGSALFEAKDAELFPAQRSREQFERFFVPVFTVVLFLVQGAGAYLLWNWLSASTTRIELKQPTLALALFASFALVLFLLGKFSATIARLENHRLLRPGASYLLLGAYLCFLVALGIAAVQADFPKADFYAAHVLCGLLAVVAVETLINLILEMYRPRLKGKVERPLYESRLVGLLGQPEGLITTAAQALDYQFGFKVSETWFYRFFERALAWLLLLQLGVLFLSTSVVFIDAGEQAVLEHLGRPVEGRGLLDPGAHLKWPWPIDQVYRFRTEQIQSFDVGLAPDPAKEQERIVLWTVPHTKEKEENFLVANREQTPVANTNTAAAKRTPPVSLITVSMPVQFQITDLKAWAYNNEDAQSLLQDLAAREVVLYLASADMNELMSNGRMEAAESLRERIQTAVDQHQLGARIISVGLQDIHPPVKVAPDFEKVKAATHTKAAKILAARADDIKTNALAGAQARRTLNQANAYAIGHQIDALARAGLFTNQIAAFQAAPSVYRQRAYLQTFAQATAPARKYILLTTNNHDVLTFDLQDKIRADILDMTPTPAKPK